jgi:hypothetical protein
VLSWLQTRRCPIAILDASAAGVPLYGRFGFVDDGATVFWRQDEDRIACGASKRVSRLQASELPELVRFDRPLFGADRSAVFATFLAEAPERAFVMRDEAGAITGYLVGQSQRLGPWAASTRDGAEELLTAALSLLFDDPPIVLAPSVNPSVASLLSRYGFSPQRSLRHMYLGPSPPRQDRTRIYGQASFAIG